MHFYLICTKGTVHRLHRMIFINLNQTQKFFSSCLHCKHQQFIYVSYISFKIMKVAQFQIFFDCTSICHVSQRLRKKETYKSPSPKSSDIYLSTTMNQVKSDLSWFFKVEVTNKNISFMSFKQSVCVYQYWVFFGFLSNMANLFRKIWKQWNQYIKSSSKHFRDFVSHTLNIHVEPAG